MEADAGGAQVLDRLSLTGVEPVEMAAWTVVASTVLNMDSFLTKE